MPRLLLVAAMVVGAAARASGQPGAVLSINLAGAWSGTVDNAGQPVMMTVVLQADGRFVQREVLLGSGVRFQQSGRYTVAALSAVSARIEYVPDAWLPLQLCQPQGGCVAAAAPGPTSVVVEVVGPDMVRSGSVVVQRGAIPAIMEAPVPESEIVPAVTMAPEVAPYDPMPAFRRRMRQNENQQQEMECTITGGHVVWSEGRAHCEG